MSTSSFSKIRLEYFLSIRTVFSWTIRADMLFIDFRACEELSIERRETDCISFIITWSTCCLLISEFRDSSSSAINQSSLKNFFFRFFRFIEFIWYNIHSCFFEIEAIEKNMTHFLTNVTDEIEMIVALTLLAVDVEISFNLRLIVLRFFVVFNIFSFLSLAIIWLEVVQTTIKRRLSVDNLLHVILQSTRQD